MFNMRTKTLRIDITLPYVIAREIELTKKKDDKLNRIVYALIQDFDDPANALNCLPHV